MSMSWWWAGAIGAARKRQDDHTADSEHEAFKNVALVVGSTGIVGASLVDILPLADTPGGPWKVYALSRRPTPPWHPPSSSSVTHVQADLTDSAAAAAALAPLTDITHVFYVAWTWRATEEENCAANSAMLRNVLAAVIPNCPALAHVTLQTGTRHYFGRVDSKNAVNDPPYTEDMPRLDMPVFYYDAVACRGGGAAAFTWSVHRPNIIFGFSPRCAINMVCCLCVYAAICRKEGTPLRWPGSLGGWEGFITPSDADLVAEHHIWAGVDAMARNEAFNCSNGDVCTWKKLWPILAERFGLEWVGYEGEEKRPKLPETMAGKDEALWAEIIDENGLVATHVSEVVNWWVIDKSLDRYGLDLDIIDSMNKSKEHGFLGFRDTVKSFNTTIDRLKAHKIVP
ncbi:unnamed protein product [Urochloa humidicola]